MDNERKRKRKAKRQQSYSYRDEGDSIPWRNVTPQDSTALLAGSDEGGFMFLEEADGEFWSTFNLAASVETAATSIVGGKKRNATRKAQEPAKTSLKTKKTKTGQRTDCSADKEINRNSPQAGCSSFQSSESCSLVCIQPAWAELRLHHRIYKAVLDLHFSEPTPIQRSCIPAAAHQGKDIIGAAETGSGKTLAYVIPILQRLLEEDEKYAQSVEEGHKEGSSLRALIVAPTRELSLQVCDHFRAMAKYTHIQIIPIVGGISIQKQERLLKRSPHVIVGTAGRLWELMSAGERHLVDLRSLSFFVLDEADRLIEKGHFKELQSIMGMLPIVNHKQDTFPTNHVDLQAMDTSNLADQPIDASVNGGQPVKCRQTLIFSATLTLPPGFKKKLKKVSFQGCDILKKHEFSVASLAQRAGMHPDAAIIDLTSKQIVADELEEICIQCKEEEKDTMLYYILQMHGCGRTIVFCTSIAAIRRVGALLKLLQIQALSLHAHMQQRQRLKAMDRFRDKENIVLVASDVAARGLDIPNVRTVIHYQLPHAAEVYVHRSGRTARASKDGCSIVLVSPSEKTKFSSLCQTLGKRDALPPFPVKEAYMPAIVKRMQLAQKIDFLLRKDVQKKAKTRWFKQNAEALGIKIDEDDSEEDDHSKSTCKKKDVVQVKYLLQTLKDMLEQPLEPKSFSHRFITGAGLSSFVAGQLAVYAKQKMKKKKVETIKGVKQVESGQRRLVVIGQEMVEPLAILRTSTAS